jgi:hypothetical protein
MSWKQEWWWISHEKKMSYHTVTAQVLYRLMQSIYKNMSTRLDARAYTYR